MEIKTITTTYSMFGNFSNYVTKKQQIDQLLPDFKAEQLNEKLPNGMQAPVLRYTSKNVAVLVRTLRIDFEYGFVNDNCSFEEFMQNVTTLTSKFADLFPDLKGNRIAYNQVAFVENKDNEVVGKLEQIFGSKEVFGVASKEFSLRVNHVKSICNEDFNTVLLVQDGKVTNNMTKQQMQVVFMNSDINSFMQNQQARFTLADSQKYVSDMMLEASTKVNTLLSKLD